MAAPGEGHGLQLGSRRNGKGFRRSEIQKVPPKRGERLRQFLSAPDGRRLSGIAAGGFVFVSDGVKLTPDGIVFHEAIMVTIHRLDHRPAARVPMVPGLQQTRSADGVVAPCPEPFQHVLKRLGILPEVMHLPCQPCENTQSYGLPILFGKRRDFSQVFHHSLLMSPRIGGFREVVHGFLLSASRAALGKHSRASPRSSAISQLPFQRAATIRAFGTSKASS